MEAPPSLSAISTQFPTGWREQWRFVGSNSVLHMATAMIFSVAIGPEVDPPERRRAVVSIVQEATTPIDTDLANFMAAQAARLVLDA